MPTYEYECKKCGKVFEVFQSIKSKPLRKVNTACELCKNQAPVVRRIGIGGGVIFRGSGFYQTDYRSESYKKAAKAEKEAVGTTADKKDAGSKTGDNGAKKAEAGTSSSAKAKETKSSGGSE